MPKKGRKKVFCERKTGRIESILTPEEEIKKLKAELKTKNEEIEDLKKKMPEIPTKITQSTQTIKNTLVKSTQTLKATLVQSTQTNRATLPKSTQTKRPKPPKPPSKKPSYRHTIWNDNALKCLISIVSTF